MRVATILLKPRRSRLANQAECKVQMDWNSTGVASSTADSVGNTLKSKLSAMLGVLPGGIVVESEFCNVLRSCNRYRIGTIYIY